MQWLYETVQGDTWDILAHDIYGSENLFPILIAANPAYSNVVVFPAGVKLVIPETPRTKTNAVRAPWDD